ncbi:response regulator transcription factor [Clostridium rectalis]|uniref:response regulator transcription factor n=1 Tax=Clostridium rectalis TaxID=2040295 RepID=UPI000F63EB6E|nr:response regulator transcription factor [Clostridium rectalis]
MKALVIEDDYLLSETIIKSIKDYFVCEYATDGEDGLYMAEQNIYDVIILDIMLPNKSGYEVLNELREKKVFTPVLFLTAKDSIEDKIKGFKIGADDYLVKPFYREELLMRLLALVRRIGVFVDNDILKFKEMKLNVKNKKVYIKGEEVNLKGKQYDILEYLINNRGTIVTKSQIFDRIWGFDSDTTINVIEVYASNLRKILKQYNYDKYIKTIRGLGYMIEEEGN